MAIYKGIEIDDALASLIRYMQGVEDYREGLGKLQSAWDILTLLGQLTGAASEMSGTREGFEKLTGELLNHLGKETLRKAVAELRAKTQVGIDILVRNLFERTADIGFLAADDDIRDYLATGGERVQLEQRFREYVAKYSVYADIVLFDAQGSIAARLAPGAASASTHRLLDEARLTQRGFIEYFGPADFLEAGDHLLYAYRVESEAGEYLGVLVLVFRLGDEMRGIFANLVGGRDPTLLATVGADGRVVASASTIQLPAGTRLDCALLQADGDIVRLAGRDYLAVACPAHSYQGYPGPGWFGLGLLPLEFAFEPQDGAMPAIDERVLDVVTANRHLFSDALREIPLRAEKIQEDLNRSVWNGSVRQMESTQANASFAKTLLWEISSTGRKTQAVFEQSIGNLNQTVVATLMQQSVSRAAFAIDVMDRNLYERANDCRWWALNSTFRRVLADPGAKPGEFARCAEILRYINGLYTVYDNLILFDGQGLVVAVSNPDSTHLCGVRLTEEWVGRCLALTSSQGYAVSRFGPTPLYGGRSTYVYAAAVCPPGGGKAVGGIAVIFDGLPQFEAMLGDTLPRLADGKPVAGALALFVRPDGGVVASASADWPVGGLFPLSEAHRRLPAGGRTTEIRELAGHYYAIGAAMATGYREFKNGDGYKEEVIAVSAVPLGPAGEGAVRRPGRAEIASHTQSRRLGQGRETLEIATFFVARQWLGLPAADVVEAIDANGVSPVFGGGHDLVVGVKPYRGDLISVLDLQRLLAGGATTAGGGKQIVVVRVRGKAAFGLLVDELGEIPEVATEAIQSVSQLAARGDALTVGVISGLRPPGDRYGMLSLLAVERICQRIGWQVEAAPEMPCLSVAR